MGIVNNVLAGASGNQGYFLSRSLRFRKSASAYLNRTPASATNRRTWTWSGWVKRGLLSTADSLVLFGANNANTDSGSFEINFQSNDTIGVVAWNTVYLATTPVYRDPSAWYHIVVALDTTQATANNRIRLYVNGSEVTVFGTRNNPTQNTDLPINNNINHQIGAIVYTTGLSRVFDGYMTEINFIDGQALTPSSFGMNDPATGVWEPKKYTGTYGTNGFYLPFTDNSNNTATTIGKDFSGNGNNWTPNNISVTAGATYDSMTDVPTLTSPTAANYCVMNPLSSRSGAGTALSNANLTQSGTSDKIFAGTIASTSGKFYYEYVVEGTTGAPTIGLANVNTYNMTTGPGETVDSWSIWLQTGETRNNASSGYTLGGFSIGDILQVAWDVDAGRVWFGKNNTWGNSGNPATATNPAFTNLSGAISPLFKQYASGSFNFGQRPFAYTPPSGFVALNTFNLPTPTIGATASSQANKYFDAVTFNNQGGSYPKTVTGLNFQPDFVWIKSRTQAYPHYLFDSVRGTGIKSLSSNSTAAEGADGVTNLSSFNSNGFTAAAGDGIGDIVGVYWSWRANQGTNVTNTAGSITSTVSANTTAGFSIVTWTGNATNGATVGHGLGVTPNMVIIKNRSAAGSSWLVEHSSISSSIAANSSTLTLTSTNCLLLNLTNGTIGYGFDYQINGSGNALVAYCFAQVAGYSRFGSYTGNGSADGPFVFCGFRPRFLLLKCSSSSDNWSINDSARDPYNAWNARLYPDLSNAENAGGAGDFLSNGFKLRSASQNTNGATYIYMAFAENPFKYSLAR